MHTFTHFLDQKISSTFLCFITSLFVCSFVLGQTNKNFEKEIVALLEKEFTNDTEPGGTVLIQKGGKTIFSRSYGLADLKTREKITENTIFNTGSISKTFVANGILILHERKLLSIEDQLTNYFPDFKNTKISDSVKIKHMLSHTSGLPDARDVSNNIEFFMTAKDTANFEPLKKVDSLIFEPGSRFQYSNPSFNGLALIIEQLSKGTWQDFIKENIFKPAGMPNSKITDGPYPDTGVAHAYNLEEGTYTEYDYGEFTTFAASGNGGIWSTVLDLANYEKAIKDHTFLNKKTTQQSRTLFKPDNWSADYEPFLGYGWFIKDPRILGENTNLKINMISHTGSQGGFRAFYISIPEKDILYIGLFNRPLKSFSALTNEGILLMKKYNWLD